jgi:phosphoglycolate phosphatase
VLADSYGRVATDLRVSLTDRCHLRCAYCMPAEGLDWLPRPELLTDDEVARLIRIAVTRLGVREVRFTGGEPLLRRGLAGIVASTATLRPRPEISLTTNGIGLARLAGPLAAAGLDRVNTSLDTLSAATFARLTRRDRLADVFNLRRRRPDTRRTGQCSLHRRARVGCRQRISCRGRDTRMPGIPGAHVLERSDWTRPRSHGNPRMAARRCGESEPHRMPQRDFMPLGSCVMCTLLILWDIDHTLIDNRGVNKQTYALAFEMLTGQRAEHAARTEGRTEPEIMQNMLLAHGIDPTPDYVSRLPAVLESATLLRASELRDRGCELPGARKALIELQRSPEIVQSVLTGNIKPNAITKLSVFGLESLVDFEVGGYGSDNDVRANLVGFAQQRATVKYGVRFHKTNTILIGDTPRDVQAGRSGGARVIAVASGADGEDALRAEGADIVLPDLANTDAVVRAVKTFGS